MIQVEELTKRYGDKAAVAGLTFAARPGRVTGFLGPNGAGKSTTMRMILGLDRPTSGNATICGRPYAELPVPLHTVGALLDGKNVHVGRTARNHLRALAAANRIPLGRVDEVLDLVGLSSVAGRRPRGFSLGMGQRLGIAAALLGDPEVIILDEPINGLDPEGIRWVRRLLRSLAAEGRTIFISSHLMSEMQETADHLVVIGKGRLLADCTMDDFLARSSGKEPVRVCTPNTVELSELLVAAGAVVDAGEGASLHVKGLPVQRIGDVAAQHGISLHELVQQRVGLEEAYMDLTAQASEYRAEGKG